MATTNVLFTVLRGIRRGGPAAALYAAAALCALAPSSLPAQTTTPTPPVLAPSSSGDIPWLSNLLEALKPGVDTSLPESSRAMTERLERQLNEGRAAETLAEIDERLAADKQKSPDTTNAQLLFLKARALNQLDRREEAKAIYRDMTQRFPELPEPWNNLAALEVADGRLDEAKTALEMAIRTAPDYAVARENLGDLYIMLAARSYEAAGKLNPTDDGARQKQTETRKLLDGAPASEPPPGTSR
ncbi:MAG: tetratricopeptide repeat protein [Pigmentiphaga sp.]|uniref:tetratricopeptide repeat protein n=1 Tax=Pigmentiphaga sp. TaxID=1977564 RepID=UPI0029A34C52|nr:tetratricopeptide repeat protein [Pigmentiphaga sp.]MDX3907719.1 tetratricopeptide repeat protein [Pigmentiphaga sp.]